MKKNYHYFYSLDDFSPGPSELLELDRCFDDGDNTFSDVFSFLDQHSFEINHSVVRRLVEFAGDQFSKRFG